MFEQAFRNIDDALRKEAGCATELDYSEQTSWLLFLKYLDGLKQGISVASFWLGCRRSRTWLRGHSSREGAHVRMAHDGDFA
jgi:hypothetical protein